jgi:hypothetical protein
VVHTGPGLVAATTWAALRTIFTSVGFWIYDDMMVGVETPTVSLEITQPREIRLHATMSE